MYGCDYLFRILFVLVIFAAFIFISCTPTIESERTDVQPASVAEDKAESSGGPPPLVVDSEAPLLLEEPTEEQKFSAGLNTQAAIENTDCFVCHANYRSEFLASRHAKANISCTGCHGQSLEHKNDENNTTPPEKMFPAEKIDSFCRGCHKSHDVSPDKIVVRWAELNQDKTTPDRIVCTDCHGEHRMKLRTVIWDKNSGKLLRTNKGQ